jgi:hypothetical protein
MRIEFLEKIIDISEEEAEFNERLGMQVKDKRYKWCRVWVLSDEIFSVKEVSEKESTIEFNDGCTMAVKGSYDETKKLVEDAEIEDDAGELTL